jgi:RNA polymerase sigma-70 factor (ECF subfamily)
MPSDSQPPEPPDRELLARAAAGDAAAFGLVYQHYQHVVYRFGFQMTASRDAAEDITQEVFVTLFRDLGRYDPSRASFTTYLYGIVRNLSRDRLRRDRRFISLHAIGLGARESVEADPFDTIDGAQAAAGVREALKQLPPRYRELIVMCDLHGLRYADAAKVANISVAAVRSRLHRGRHLLRERWSRIMRASPSHALSTKRCAYDI